MDSNRIPQICLLEAHRETSPNSWWPQLQNWLSRWNLQTPQPQNITMEQIKDAYITRCWNQDPLPTNKTFYKNLVRSGDVTRGTFFLQEHLEIQLPAGQDEALMRCRTRTAPTAYIQQRWKKLPHHQRVCAGCKTGSIGDENHFFLQCSGTRHCRDAHRSLISRSPDFQTLMQQPPEQVAPFVAQCYTDSQVTWQNHKRPPPPPPLKQRLAQQAINRAKRFLASRKITGPDNAAKVY